ncbi:hypothetical protein [Flindersiella endophytica]
MEYRLLGPVEVYDGTRSIRLGGPRRLTVQGSPPATARQQILIAIPALRRELGDAIVTAIAGYRLRAEPDAIDLCRFEQAAGLRDALLLWRARRSVA